MISTSQDLIFPVVTGVLGVCVISCALICCWRDSARRHRLGDSPDPSKESRGIIGQQPLPRVAVNSAMAMQLLTGWQAPVRRLDKCSHCKRVGNNPQPSYAKVTSVSDDPSGDRLARLYGTLAGSAEDDDALTPTPRSARSNRSVRSEEELTEELEKAARRLEERAFDAAPSRRSSEAPASRSSGSRDARPGGGRAVPVAPEQAGGSSGSAPAPFRPRGSAARSGRAPAASGLRAAASYQLPRDTAREELLGAGASDSASSTAPPPVPGPGRGRSSSRHVPTVAAAAAPDAVVLGHPGAAQAQNGQGLAAASAHAPRMAPSASATAFGQARPIPEPIGRADAEAESPPSSGEETKASDARSPLNAGRAKACATAAAQAGALRDGGDLLSQIDLPSSGSPPRKRGGGGGAKSWPGSPTGDSESAAGGTREAKFDALDAELGEEMEAEVGRAVSFVLNSKAFPRTSKGLPRDGESRRASSASHSKPGKKKKASAASPEGGGRASRREEAGARA
mmetsp:Transcript_42980/g.96869  ORF Transcript_42980/g.96869 Transcript_42980/m.96869 type:complete len:511 (+) Transcript_42980:91-1623(+)